MIVLRMMNVNDEKAKKLGKNLFSFLKKQNKNKNHKKTFFFFFLQNFSSKQIVVSFFASLTMIIKKRYLP